MGSILNPFQNNNNVQTEHPGLNKAPFQHMRILYETMTFTCTCHLRYLSLSLGHILDLLRHHDAQHDTTADNGIKMAGQQARVGPIDGHKRHCQHILKNLLSTSMTWTSLTMACPAKVDKIAPLLPQAWCHWRIGPSKDRNTFLRKGRGKNQNPIHAFKILDYGIHRTSQFNQNIIIPKHAPNKVFQSTFQFPTFPISKWKKFVTESDLFCLFFDEPAKFSFPAGRE